MWILRLRKWLQKQRSLKKKKKTAPLVDTTFCRCLPTKQPPLNWFSGVLDFFKKKKKKREKLSTRLSPRRRFTEIWPKFKRYETLSHSWHHFWKESSLALFSFLDLFFSTSRPQHKPNIPYLQRWQQQSRGHRRLLGTPERLIVACCRSLNPRGPKWGKIHVNLQPFLRIQNSLFTTWVSWKVEMRWQTTSGPFDFSEEPREEKRRREWGAGRDSNQKLGTGWEVK